MARILVVDDEENMLRLFKKVLGRSGYDVLTATTGTEALRLLREQPIDIIISDLVMPILNGLELLKEVKTYYPDIPFIVLTAYGTIKSAVEAIKSGAFDYLTKPFQKDEIVMTLERALKMHQLQEEVKRLREELKIREGVKELIFKSKAMESVLNLVGKVADSQATVLIQGESGTGKELIAQAIHNLSSRKNGPFVAVDCNVLPEQLLQSELFGHVRGAFTGAIKDKKGLFLAAHGGTLFLDEIGNITPAVQLNLLRVLQEKEIKPVGSISSSKVDVRVVAATNVKLEDSLKKGGFRKDLYYRLAVVTIVVPPLRQRPEDIPLLAYHFMHKYAALYQKNLTEITPPAMRSLMENPWPGNVRELENVLERAVLLNTDPLMEEQALSFSLRPEEPTLEKSLQPLKTVSRELTQEGERKALLMALTQAGGNRSKAAKLLGISRSSLYNKLKALNLESGSENE